jgi:hypothetical protein
LVIRGGHHLTGLLAALHHVGIGVACGALVTPPVDYAPRCGSAQRAAEGSLLEERTASPP